MRVTSAVPRKQRKKGILELAKGFRGRKKNCYKLAIDMVIRKLKYEYRDRRTKKRQIRSLWITRINAAARENGMNYSTFIHKCQEQNININRKMIAEIAAREDNSVFKEIFSKVLE